jgi:MYXO-CTERM domain-containing protein
MRRFQTIAAFSIAATLSISASADVITDWNGTAVEAARSFANPNPATYAIVLAHLAAYDAVNAIHVTGAPYLSDATELSATPDASVDAAAAQAFHDVLIVLIKPQKSAIDTALATSLASVPDGAAKSKGVAVGAAAAAAILEARKADVTNPDPAPAPFVGEEALAKWRPTPRELAANAPLAGNTPWWAALAPFALASADVYDPGPPPALTSARYATDYLEVKQYGAKTGSVRSADQTAIARFWAQQTHVPFNAIARSLSLRHKLSVDQNARLFALLNLAIADSRIAVWNAKYKYQAWRPITAINDQTDDGNSDTVPFPAPALPTDPTWIPLLETPNHPEYPSGHSGTGAAAAGVLSYWFGNDAAFTMGSDSYLGFTRSFTSFAQAAQENANSRIYGGIHFRYANEAGIKLGYEIAERVTSTYLAANERPGGAGGEGGVGGQSAGGESAGGVADVAGGQPGAAGTGGTGTTAGTGGTGAPLAGTAGNATEAEGGAPDEGGAPNASGGTASRAGSATRDGDSDSGCSVTAPSGGERAWLLLLTAGAGVIWRRRRTRH